MSDFNKYSMGNQRFQAELPIGADPTVRGSQLQKRNISTFNPIGFNPNPQLSNDDIEKQRKKELQQQYRDQLDQMVANNVVRKNSTKLVEDYSKQYYGEPERVQPYQNSIDQRRNEYERYQQAQELEKRSSNEHNEDYNRQGLGQYSAQGYGNNQGQNSQNSNPNQRFRQQTPTQNPITGNWQSQDVGQSQGQRAYSRPEEKNSFAQQDELREQLLSKIRTGYTKNNNKIYNVYQRAHDEKEKHMLEFERNVVDKAAQERIEKEDQRALTEWEKKKKLAWETNFANKKALEEKSVQKRHQHFNDQESDKRRIHDSLAQFERQEVAERERKRKIIEENNKVLEQQRREQTTKTNKLFNDEIPGQALTTNQRYGHGLSPEKKVRDKEPLERRHQGEYNFQGENDVLTSMEKLNVKGYQQEANDYQQKYYQDQAYQQYAKELEEREAQNQIQQYPPYQQPRSLGDRELGQDTGANLYQRDYDAPEKYSRGKEPVSQQEIRQDAPYSPSKQNNARGDARSDYLKIRDKARYGNSFNIISNEYK